MITDFYCSKAECTKPARWDAAIKVPMHKRPDGLLIAGFATCDEHRPLLTLETIMKSKRVQRALDSLQFRDHSKSVAFGYVPRV